jgi:hypothetical protein
LIVGGPNGKLAVATCHGLYANDSHPSHPLNQLGLDVPVKIVNEFLLTRNLPVVARDIFLGIR